nr:hypothetical protein [Mycoplasmopsis bovis]
MYTHYMIKDEKLKKCLTFTKIFWNYLKTRVHSEMKVYTTEFINYLSLIIATKVKNNLIRLNLHQNYSFRLDYRIFVEVTKLK